METGRGSNHCRRMAPHPKTAAALALFLLASCNASEAPVQTANEAAQKGAETTPAAPSDGDSATSTPAAPDAEMPATADAEASACLTQDGERIPDNRLKGVGTEPFWGVRIEGRCVTYSTPEDQDGTRVWTQFSGTAESGTWTGALDKQPFVLRTHPEPGCSDGMSDNRYPIAVTLAVRGEERTGCAEPL